ncbi:lipoprotein LipO [Spirochaetia bacterium]|nr:lipoprotein LipO [Spirochaetia bacterium]
MKKAAIIGVLIVGLLALAGCGSKSGKAKAIEAEPGPVGRYKEPLVLQWGVNARTVQKFFNGDTYENNIWSRKIKNDLNIDVQVAFTADWSTGAYDTQLNLKMASGDLPDLLRISSYRIFKDAVDAGMLADITDVFEQYASDELKDMVARYPSSLEYVKVNGRMYGIPPFNGNAQMAPLLWIREDWLRNVGMQPPKTVNEMIAVARAFRNNDPDRNGKKDTYGILLQSGLNARDHGTIGGLLSAFGLPNHNFDMYYLGKDGKITIPYIQPEIKEGLQILQDMYKEDLIDPEWITTDISRVGQEVARGHFGMGYGPQWGTWSPWNNAYNADSDWAIVRAYPIPTAAGYTPRYGYNSDKASGEIIVINSKVSNPEALIKMVNHYIAFNNDWTSDDDRLNYNDNEQYSFAPTWIAEPQEIRVQPIMYEALITGNTSNLPPVLLDWYNKIKAFQANPKGHDFDTYGRWGQYAEDMAMTIILGQYKPSGNLMESLLGSEQPQSLLTNGASLEKIINQGFTEIITGQHPVSYFDTIVQQYLTAGGQQVLDDLDKIYGSGAAK